MGRRQEGLERLNRSYDLPRLSAGVEAVRRSDRSMQQCRPQHDAQVSEPYGLWVHSALLPGDGPPAAPTYAHMSQTSSLRGRSSGRYSAAQVFEPTTPSSTNFQ